MIARKMMKRSKRVTKERKRAKNADEEVGEPIKKKEERGR